MEVTFNIDIKTIKRAMAILKVDIPSDKEIEEKFAKNVADFGPATDAAIEEAKLGFAMMAIGAIFYKEKFNDNG